MKFRRIITLVLALALVGTLLTGCGAAKEEEGTTTPESTAATKESTQAATTAAERTPVELTWYVAGPGPQSDMPAVLAEVNKYLKDKLNATLKMVESDFGSYTQKMQMVIASQEKYDMCYTAHWSNSYYSNVSKNAFLQLDDLLDQHAPDLKASMPQGGWDAAKVNGKIYAVPNQQIWPYTNGICIVKEYLDKYGIDPSTIKSLKDVEPLMAAIKKDNPQMYPLAVSQTGILQYQLICLGYDELAGRNIPGAVMLDDSNLQVINQFELPQVMDLYKLAYDWSKKGYIRPDALTVTDVTPDAKAGKHAIGFEGNIKPGGEIMDKENFGGRDMVVVPLSNSYLTTSGITATMTAISMTSENPDRAMEFLNLVNTDATLFNLINYGIEGKHYEKVDDTYVKPIANSGYDYAVYGWMFGNQFLAKLVEGQQPDVWAKTAELNRNATPSVALGFSFDPTPVQDEIAAVNAVVKEYEGSLSTGSVDPEKTLPEFLSKLEQAGGKTIVGEVQKQVNAWKAAK